MRRVFVLVIAFSLILSACTKSSFNTEPFAERDRTAFTKWTIPGYFVPERIRVIGLGDSLTQGVGDDRKKGGYFGRLTDRMNEWKGVKEITAENLAKRGRRSDQLLEQFDEQDFRREIRNANIILLTIGGNDIMKIVKGNLFDLRTGPFYKELVHFEERLDEIFTSIRLLNDDALIVVAGLYNPFSIVTDEVNEFEEIIHDWNEAIEMRTVLDEKSCFVPVTDLFDSNVNMVYHTDFFHPNAKGYELMTERYLASIEKCGLYEMSDGDLEM
ncbi:GDSL-type esterase/lipase family protein [Sporosarcina sp. 179-K 3D1 HS]|uniref:GDSL-type esterase/lipase family protein n=1 Tax=Sporosarcina sp. 179-K 3D1 HS TaxID=3232169 RepID=UPI0039A0B7FD